MRSKFNSPQKKKDKPVIDGYTFDSELEARYYLDMIKPLFSLAAVIKSFKVHSRYEIIPKTSRRPAVHYIADFEITYDGGNVVVVDVKGMATEAAILKRKLFEWRYPELTLVWACYSQIDGGWVEYDELRKARAKRKKEKKAKGAI